MKPKTEEHDTVVLRTPRFLLAFSALLLAVGGAMHAAAFKRALTAIGTSNLTPFFGNSLKLLWLGDSTTLLTLAVVFGVISARPSVATKPVVVLLAFIPAATAVLIYVFLGNFFAGHILLATAAATFFAGLQFPGVRAQADGADSR